MASIPKILTNKTVLTGIPSSFSAASIFKPASGAAGAMGKIEALGATAKIGGMKGAFTPGLGVSFSAGPKGLGAPFFTLKKPVLCR